MGTYTQHCVLGYFQPSLRDWSRRGLAFMVFKNSVRFFCYKGGVKRGFWGAGWESGWKCGGIPHLAKNERDAPNFLHAAPDKTACAPFFKERRMKFAEPTRLHRKSGVWGTRHWLQWWESYPEQPFGISSLCSIKVWRFGIAMILPLDLIGFTPNHPSTVLITFATTLGML